MDFLIEKLLLSLPFINIIALLIIAFKIYLLVKAKSSTVLEVVISFFQIRPRHEIEISTSRAKRNFMYAHNWLNFALYFIIALNLFFRFVINR